MKQYRNQFFFTLLTLFIVVTASPVYSATYDNRAALEGISSPKTLFDINLKEAKKLSLYLNVIKMTYNDIKSSGLEPDMVLAFRGPSVRLISSETGLFAEEDQQSLKQSAKILAELAALGVRIEACAIATNLFKIDNNTILRDITVVGNTFVSLTGYQNKGYALIPIQ